jgi:cell division septum initiation protein DivIVA
VRVLALVGGGLQLGLGAEDLALVAMGIEEAGLDPAEVGPWLADVMREYDQLDGEVLKAQSELREWRVRVREAAEDLATVNARVKKLSRILERAGREPALARSLRLADSEVGRDVLDAALRAAEEIGAGARS